jgi:hypothetical protein
VKGRRAECGGQLGPDGDQRLPHDGKCRWIREATARHERRGEPARMELFGDLWARAVDDDHVVARSMEFEHDFDGVGGDAAAQLQRDSHQVVYSAFSFT